MSMVGKTHTWLTRKELDAELLVAVCDPASCQVVSRNFNLNAISGKDANVMLAHLAAQVTKNFVSVIQLNSKVTALKRFDSLPLKQDGIVLLFRQTNFPSIAV